MFCPVVQDGRLVREDRLPVDTAQRTHHMMKRAVDCIKGSIETLVVTNVGAELCFLFKTGPSLVQDDSQLVHAERKAVIFTGQDGSTK